jgi:hypothetical protein
MTMRQRLSLNSLAVVVLILGLGMLAGPATAQPVATPGFSHSARTYVTPFALNFDVPDGATVRYTVNGSTPSQSSLLYQPGNPVSISSTRNGSGAGLSGGR